MMLERKEKKVPIIEKKKIIACASIFIFSAIIAVLIYFIPSKKQDEEPRKVDFSGVTEICELATLRCYYHDVAKLEDYPKGWFKYGWGKYGYKKLWMEYDAIVEMGIDASKVEVNEPDENGIVQIYIPQVEIQNVYPIEDSMEDPITEKGKFTKITIEDKRDAFADAQAEMKESAKTDKAQKKQAYENAQKLLEQYVLKIGKLSGKQYTVEWIDKPKTQNEGDKTDEE